MAYRMNETNIKRDKQTVVNYTYWKREHAMSSSSKKKQKNK